MNNDTLKEIFSSYYKEYNKIFGYMDPRIEADRFNEENQTVNFCRAIQEKYANAIVWYEYPWKTKNITEEHQKNSCYRFDAVVYLPNEEILFVIEAKCLRKKSKYEAINKDLERICGKIKEINQNEKILINVQKPKKIYAVILADYWKCKNARTFKNINGEWNSHTTSNDFDFNTFKNNINKWIDNPEWIISEDKTFYNYENYYLMSMIGEIKDSEEIYTFNCKG